MIKRGEIYLFNFGKKYNSELGKIRPALIIQNDIANRNIDKVAFKGVTVIPLSTNICGGDVRVLVRAREKLEQDSEACINEICTLDISRITLESSLCKLGDAEMAEVEEKVGRHLGLL